MINNKLHVINNVKLPKDVFQRIKFVLINEEQQGWHPSDDEVISLIKSDIHPSPMIKNDMKELDIAMAQDSKY